MELGEILRNLRLKQGLSQVDVAQSLSVSTDLYNKYERAGIRPPYELLIKIGKLFRVCFC